MWEAYYDVGSVFPGTLMGFDTGLKELGIFFFPGFDLLYAAARIFVQWDIVPPDELGIAALNVESVVLGVVFAGLSTIVAEIADIVKTHLVFEIGLLYFGGDAGFDLRIEVVSLFVADVKEPGHVVDPGDQFLSAFELVLKVQ